MGRLSIRAALLVLVTTLPTISSWGQPVKTSVDSIIACPGCYVGKSVEVSGLVTQYVPSATSSTSYYLLKGDYGSIVKVNTAEVSPKINKEYIVVGIVYADPVDGQPFLSEKSRTEVVPWWAKVFSDPLVLTIIGVIVILLVLLLYLQLQRARTSRPSALPVPPPIPPIPPPLPPDDVDGPKTIHLTRPDDRTMKFIPGRLVFTDGVDKGKSFRIAGFPTPDGAVVTIGRARVMGERAYAHLQIDQQFQTVSHKQAEMVYCQDGKFILRNLSNTNFTIVDNVELKPGEVAPVKNESIIKMGELELQYKL